MSKSYPQRKKSKIIYTAQELEKLISTLATAIYNAHKNQLGRLVFIGILSNGYPLAQRLNRLFIEKWQCDIPLGKLDIALYRDDLLARGKFVTIRETDIPFNLQDKILILIDDVLFNGRTIRAALNALLDFGRPASIELAVLIDRGYRELPVFANYVGEQLQTELTDHIKVNLLEINGEDSIKLEKK